MDGGNGALETEILLRLTQFERQLARAEAKAIATANKAEKSLAKINGKPFDDMAQRYVAATTAMQQKVAVFAGVKGGFDDAAASARAFQDAMDQRDGIDRLRASLDPLYASSRRYESAVEQIRVAVATGAITQAEANRVLSLAESQYLGTASAATTLRNTTTLASGGVANLGYQFNDIAVMLAAGQNPLMLAIQQGTQISQVIGPMGAAGAVKALKAAFLSMLSPVSLVTIGVIAAVAAATQWVMTLSDAEEEVVTAEDRTKRLAEAVNKYREASVAASASSADMAEKYGSMADEAQRALNVMAALAEAQALAELGEKADQVAASFGRIASAEDYMASGALRAGGAATETNRTIAEMAETLGVTEVQAKGLAWALRDLAEAEGPKEVAAAAQLVLDRLEAALGPVEGMKGAAAALAGEMAGLIEKSSDFVAALEEAPSILGDIIAAANNAATAVHGIGTAAVGIIGRLQQAAIAAWDLAKARVAANQRLDEIKFEHSPGGQALVKYGSRGAEPSSDQTALIDRNTPDKPSRGGRGGRSGGGGKKEAFDVGQDEIDQLQRSIEMIGLNKAQIAELEARYEMLAEAKRRGLDLDKAQAGSLVTLRDQIDQNAAAIGRLTAEYEGASERSKFLTGMQEDLKNGFLDAVIEGENLSDVLGGLAKSLARAALEAALFKTGPLAGGGGGLGGLLSGLFGRATGGGVQAGQAYRVNEARGPSEVFVPSQSGAVLSVSQAQRALAAPGRNGGGAVDVRVHGGELSITDGGQIAAQIRVTAMAAKAAAVQEIRRGFGSMSDQYQTDGALL